MTPLEAMACARPVVGSDVGGLKYSIVDGQTGYLIPPDDPPALAERLHMLLSGPEAAEAMGRRGLQRVRERFTWDRVAAEVALEYQRLLAAPVAIQTSHEIETARGGFDEAIEVLARSRDSIATPVIDAARAIDEAFRAGGKLLICGNGGSASDAQHFAGELVGRFQLPHRPPLPAIALTTDTAVLTAWANDVSFDDVYARQVRAHARAGDVIVGISTSGESVNVLRAVEAGREAGATSVALTGRGGGALARAADIAIIVPSENTQRIQEAHGVVIHLLCELIESYLVDGLTQTPAVAEVSGVAAIDGEGWRPIHAA
jgi:phosphoheptose isomerase